MGFVEFHNAKDSYIWNKFRDGNASAFEIIYERNFNMLANYGNRMWQDKDLVKDAMQDMFVDLWRNRTNLGYTDSIKFYLLIAFRRNLIKKIVAAKKLDSLVDTHGVFSGAFELAHDLSMISAEIEESKLNELNNQLDNLSPRQKEAIFLRFYSGLNFAEISKTMGINKQSAYNMVFRALEILRERMAYNFTTFLFLLLHIFNV